MESKINVEGYEYCQRCRRYTRVEDVIGEGYCKFCDGSNEKVVRLVLNGEVNRVIYFERLTNLQLKRLISEVKADVVTLVGLVKMLENEELLRLGSEVK